MMVDERRQVRHTHTQKSPGGACGRLASSDILVNCKKVDCLLSHLYAPMFKPCFVSFFFCFSFIYFFFFFFGTCWGCWITKGMHLSRSPLVYLEREYCLRVIVYPVSAQSVVEHYKCVSYIFTISGIF